MWDAAQTYLFSPRATDFSCDGEATRPAAALAAEKGCSNITSVHRTLFLCRFSDKLRNFLLSYYKSEGEGNMGEFICSQPDSSGMHKCSNLPPYVVDGRECSGSVETGLHNKAMTTISF